MGKWTTRCSVKTAQYTDYEHAGIKTARFLKGDLYLI